MKELKKYIALILIIGFGVSCEGPGPTELMVDDNSDLDELEIEILSPEPGLIDYSNGYDSTGIVEPILQHSVVISISGIKTTLFNTDFEHAFYAAVFSDKSQPVYSPNNRLLGYRSFDVGQVRFGNRMARLVSRMMGFRHQGIGHDTSLGQMYVLGGKGHGMGMRLDFPYNSSVPFNLIKNDGTNISFNIPTPEEITGEVIVRGSKSEGNLVVAMKWNGIGRGRIEFIIGGGRRGDPDIIPLFRVKTFDDGEVKLPPTLIRSIPFEKFEVITVSFERNIVLPLNDSQLNDSHIISKSIHNIGFDVP